MPELVGERVIMDTKNGTGQEQKETEENHLWWYKPVRFSEKRGGKEEKNKYFTIKS